MDASPLISSPTRSEAMNVETVINRIQSGRIVIPDYQRDAEQWDSRKESLFIESLINNLTIPAFFFSETDGKFEVVDGQQRITTIQKFMNGHIKIDDDPDIVYLSPQSSQYRGKSYVELEENYKNALNDYPLSIIYLPREIDLSTKLEIFRRINEGGTPLTGQDIRLSYYSTSSSVFFLRLAGICSNSAYQNRILQAADERGLSYAWDVKSDSWCAWSDWWEGKRLAKGQTPSEMFLWYLVTLNRNKLDSLLKTPDSLRHLPLIFRGSTDEALDIYCAQLQYTDLRGGPDILPTLGKGLETQFASFASWIENMLSYGLTGVSVDKYKQMALIMAAATELNISTESLTSTHWGCIGEFIRTPRASGNKWLKGGYPEPKGRWGGLKGQKAQCDAAVELLKNIVS